MEDDVTPGPGQSVADSRDCSPSDLARHKAQGMEAFLFWIFAVIGVGCGILVVFHRNPMSSAIYLVVTMLCLAGLYALLSGPFVSTIQVLVYAGAVMVLMLFVIMMFNLRDEAMQREGSLLT